MHGDQNTTFFRRKDSKRQRTNSISKIKDIEGNIFKEEDDIDKLLYQ